MGKEKAPKGGLVANEYDLLKAFDTEIFYLTIAGFYPKKTPKYKYLYILAAIFNFSLEYLQFIAMATLVYQNFSDVSKVSEALLFCMTQFAFLNKLNNFIINKSNWLLLEEMLENPVFRNVISDEELIVTLYISGGKRIAKIYRVLCVLVVVFYALFPFMDNRDETQHKFPLPAWFPFNPNEYYYEVFSAEILSIAIGAWINSNIDILTIMAIILGTAQFEVLKRRIKMILKPAIDGIPVGEDIVQDRVKKCIIHYNDLLCYVSQIEKTYSKGIFIQFLSSVIVICLTGFQILMISFNSMQFVLLIIYFSCMMLQIIMYCWYGHMIVESILRSSYSYFAVLQRIYSKGQIQ
ncbi:hypothetical protein NQ318_007595 [Aromia moschata]|uniref:Odorant receptor n=1 Tax=Aromia moschata TaxID=1265417 RepID=A0AAV8YC91_9CUCU|nr:hypothetical protein NQ318_007595 [Aromia moschata]